MIPVNEIFQDCEDKISPAENGYFSFGRFNRFSWLGQLRLVDWISGSMSGQQPPEPYLTQKNKDWLSDFIVKISGNVTNGEFPKPDSYYQWDNAYKIGNKSGGDCDEDEPKATGCNTPIELLDGQQFHGRCNTYIEELKPESKPICKMLGKKFIFLPEDLGPISIEYIRYPLRAVLNTVLDPVYNEEVYDPATSVDFEWPEFARELLVWFIVNSFADSVRERALKETNIVTGKTVRDAR